MHMLINKICLVEFDQTSDGNYSAITGHVLAVDDVGLLIKRDSDGETRYIQWTRVRNTIIQ